MASPFSIFPVELLQLKLTETELRVLIALYSFRAKNTETVWPSLPNLADRAGIKDHTRVSKITRRLAEKGCLEKKKSGYKGNNLYRLIVPDIGVESTNLDESANLDESTNSTLDKPTNTTLDESSKLNKHTNEQTIEHTIAKKVDPMNLSLATYLFQQIKKIAKSAKEPNYEKWADTIRLMRQEDHLELSRIRAVFDWANQDGFWKTNILSPTKLRKHFAQLEAKMNQEVSHGTHQQHASQSRKDAVSGSSRSDWAI